MNKDWSEKQKTFSKLISKEETFKEGINMLLELRKEFFNEVTSIVKKVPAESFSEMPFAKSKGNQAFTLSWSIWHIFRIEDVVCHELIAGDEQVFVTGKWKKKIGSPLVTTANELNGNEFVEFSKTLDVNALYDYACEVKKASDFVLKKIDFSDAKIKVSDEAKNRLIKSGCVSEHEDAVWLVDYWCSKDFAGLIKMPFSRHWIMHIEAMMKISDKVLKKINKFLESNQKTC